MNDSPVDCQSRGKALPAGKEVLLPLPTKNALLSTKTKVRFLNDVCLRQMMLAVPMMTATPNDVCLRAHKGKHRIIASETSNIILSEAKNIISRSDTSLRYGS